MDYLFTLGNVYALHFISYVFFVFLDDPPHVSYVELLQFHFRIDRDVIFFDLGDMARYIDFAL